MLGLGLGGRLYRRLGGLLGARGASLYRRLEVGLALAAVAAPFLIRSLEEVLLGVARQHGTETAALDLLRLVLATATVLPPAVLMGATLPAVCEDLPGGAGDEAAAGSLYAANTLGAVLGAVGAGYLLLPRLGLHATGLVAAGLSLAAAALIPDAGGTRPADPPPAPDPISGLALPTYAFVGFWGMALEVFFTRLVLATTGSSSYALATVLGAFLTGIAGGSFLAARWLPIGDDPIRSLARRLAALGALTALSASLVSRHNTLYLTLVPLDSGLLGAQLATWMLAGIFLLPAGLGLGAIFPAAVRCLLRDGGTADAVGRAYFVNSVAGALGAFAAHHWIAPWTGIAGGVAAAAAAMLVAGAVLLTREARRPREAALALVVAVAVGYGARHPHHLVQAGYRFRSAHGARALQAFEDTPDREVVWYRDGPDASVAVARAGEHITLRINGKTDASTTGDMLIQLMIGHLPFMVRNPRGTHLMIGLGAGGSADALLHHPIERLEVAELCPTVAAGARAGFEKVFPLAFHDPRARIQQVDGRLMVRAWPEQVDAILSEPTNIFIQGVSNLYTDEFFRATRDRLKPDGLLVQWLQAYDLPTEATRLVVRTLLRTFSHLELYWMDDFLLVASQEPIPLDARLVRAALHRPGVAEQLRKVGIRADLGGIAARRVAGTEALRRWVGEGEFLSDDRPRLEYLAAAGLFQGTHAGQEVLREFAPAPGRREEIPVRGLLVPLPGGRLAYPEAGLTFAPGFVPEAGLVRMSSPIARGRVDILCLPVVSHRGPRGDVQIDTFLAHELPPEAPHMALDQALRAAGRAPAPRWQAKVEGHVAIGQSFPGVPGEPRKVLLTWTCDHSGHTYVMFALGADAAQDQALLLETLTHVTCVPGR